LSLSSVYSAEVIVTGSNTTSEIQSIITDSNNDIVFEGAFNNLSTLYITREIQISGNNATITRNTSNTANLTLFNITSSNVIIQNLVMKGYNNTVVSNSSNLSLLNNQIIANYTAINITSNGALSNIKIINNTINTNRTSAYGIYFNSSSGGVYNNVISGNKITTDVGSSVGIFLNSYSSNLYNNVISDNVIITTRTGSSAHGIELRVNDGKLNNNNILRNNITTRSAHGIYIYLSTGAIEDNNIQYNNIKFTVETQTNSTGIFVNSQPGNMSNNLISNNNIEAIVNHVNGGARGIDLNSNSAGHIMIDNIISNNNISINSNHVNSYGIFVYAWSGSANNTSIFGNNIFTNSTAIRVGASSGTINHLNISYNRILTNGTFISLDKTVAGPIGINNTASANWFGNNTPDMSKFIGIDVVSYYVVTATAFKNTGGVGENWIIKYGFYLNNTNNAGDFDKLPFFMSQLFNVLGNQISERIAYENGMWTLAIEIPTIEDFTMVLDNEIIPLNVFVSDKGQTNITADIGGNLSVNNTVTIDVILKNSEGNPLANQIVTLIIDGVVVESKITDSEGKASFNYVFNSSGNYTIFVSFEGDDNYEGSNYTLLVTVPGETGTDVNVNETDNNSTDPEDSNAAGDNSTDAKDDSDSNNVNVESKYFKASKSLNDANISMENTGIPLLVLVILFLAILVPSFIVRKRK
jgi:hypothetical protein